MNLWPVFLSFLGFGATHDSTTATCIESGAGVNCYYAGKPSLAMADAMMVAAGNEMMARPWATDSDIRPSAIAALVGERPVVANVILVGDYGLLFAQDSAGLMSNVAIDYRPASAAVTIKGMTLGDDPR